MATEEVYGLVDNAVSSYNFINPIFNSILIASIILLIGFIVGKLLGKFILKVLSELEADKAIKKTTGWKISFEKGTSAFVTYFIYFIAIIMALDNLGVTSAVLNMIAGIIVLILLVSFILAIKDFVPNAMSGIRLKSKEEFRKGSKIKVKGIEGSIKEIGLLETKIITRGKDLILIPNAIFSKHETTIKN